jgi:hypothetical protein
VILSLLSLLAVADAATLVTQDKSVAVVVPIGQTKSATAVCSAGYLRAGVGTYTVRGAGGVVVGAEEVDELANDPVTAASWTARVTNHSAVSVTLTTRIGCAKVQ